MRTSTLLLALLLLASLATAQNATADFKYALKLSNLSTLRYSRIRDMNGNFITGANFHAFNIQPGFLLRGNRGNFWDFTLQNIYTSLTTRTNASVPGSGVYSFLIDFKVGHFFAFRKQKTVHWAPMLGLEAAPFLSVSRAKTPKSAPANPYFKNSQAVGTQLFLTPRIMWCPDKRIFVDASLNINLLKLRYDHTVNDDPAYPYHKRSYLGLALANDRLIRLTIGVGLKL